MKLNITAARYTDTQNTRSRKFVTALYVSRDGLIIRKRKTTNSLQQQIYMKYYKYFTKKL